MGREKSSSDTHKKKKKDKMDDPRKTWKGSFSRSPGDLLTKPVKKGPTRFKYDYLASIGFLTAVRTYGEERTTEEMQEDPRNKARG